MSIKNDNSTFEEKLNKKAAYFNGEERDNENNANNVDYYFNDGEKQYKGKKPNEKLLLPESKRSKKRLMELGLLEPKEEEDDIIVEPIKVSKRFKMVSIAIFSLLLAAGLGYGLSFLIPDGDFRRNSVTTATAKKLLYFGEGEPNNFDVPVQKGVPIDEVNKDFVLKSALTNENALADDFVELNTLDDDGLYTVTKENDPDGSTTTALSENLRSQYAQVSLLNDYLYKGTEDAQPSSLELPSVMDNYFPKTSFSAGNLYMASGTGSTTTLVEVNGNKYIEKETLSNNLIYTVNAGDSTNKDTFELEDASNKYTNTESIANDGLYSATKTTTAGVTTTDFGEEASLRFTELNTLSDERLYTPVKTVNDGVTTTTLTSKRVTDYVDTSILDNDNTYFVTKTTTPDSNDPTDRTKDVTIIQVTDASLTHVELNTLKDNGLYIPTRTVDPNSNVATTTLGDDLSNKYVERSSLEDGGLYVSTKTNAGTDTEATTISENVRNQYFKKPEDEQMYTVRFNLNERISSVASDLAGTYLPPVSYRSALLSKPADSYEATENVREDITKLDVKIGETYILYYTTGMTIDTTNQLKDLDAYRISLEFTLNSVDDDGNPNYSLVFANGATSDAWNVGFDPFRYQDTPPAIIATPSFPLADLDFTPIISSISKKEVDLDGTDYIEKNTLNQKLLQKVFRVRGIDPTDSSNLVAVDGAISASSTYIRKSEFKIYDSKTKAVVSTRFLRLKTGETKTFYIIGPNLSKPANVEANVFLVRIDVTLGADGKLSGAYVLNHQEQLSGTAAEQYVNYSVLRGDSFSDSVTIGAGTPPSILGTAVPDDIINWLFIPQTI